MELFTLRPERIDVGLFDWMTGSNSNQKKMPIIRERKEIVESSNVHQQDKDAGSTKKINVFDKGFDINKEIPSMSLRVADFVAFNPAYRWRNIGDIALKLGFITRDNLDFLLKKQAKLKRRFDEIALQEDLLSQDQIDRCRIDQKITILIDKKQSADHEVMTWISDCKKKFEPHIRFVWSEQKEISNLREEMDDKKRELTVESIGLETLNSAIRLFQECSALRGSDIHIMVRENFTEIQLRVKNELKTVQTMTKKDGEDLVRAIYTGLASVKDAMFNQYEYQDAQISGDNVPGAGLTSVRIIRGPCYPVEEGGQFLIARLQYGQKKATSFVPTLEKKEPSKPSGSFKLNEKGYTSLQIKLLEKMTRMPSGIILVTGPTGSGKTTTLNELMMQQARMYPGLRHVTVENPVEYPMSWAIQMPVVGAKNDKESGEKYLNAVRMTLRMDPDIILLGELRGAEEAKAAVQEAMTGHLVWSTIHVVDPYMVIDRLEQLDRVGLHRTIICDHKLLRGIVAQRLVPVLCPKCKKRAMVEDFSEELRNNIKAWNDLFIEKGIRSDDADLYVKGDGCEHCGGDKVTSVIAVAEVVITTPELMQTIIEQGTDAGRKMHRESEFADMSMLGNAMIGVCSGKFDPDDVERAVDIIEQPGKE